MKLKIFVVILFAAIVFLFAANSILSRSAVKIVNTTVAGQLKKDIGLELKVESVKVNILGGSIEIKGINAGTPPVFDEETALVVGECRLNLGILSFLAGVTAISEATVEDASITFARIKGTRMNIPLPLGVPAAGKPSEKIPEEVVKQPQIDFPKIRADNVSINTEVNYVDYDIGTEPLRLGLNISLEADGIKTYGKTGAESEWGTFLIKTSLKGNPEKFVSEIKGRLAPVVDITTASFDIDALIKYIDLREMQSVADELGVTTSDLSIEAHLKCRDGVFDRINSTLKIVCLNPQPAGKHADKAKYMSKIKKIEIPLHLGGTLEKPDIGSWEQALLNAILANFSSLGSPVLDALSEKASEVDTEKVEEEITKGLRKLDLDKLF